MDYVDPGREIPPGLARARTRGVDLPAPARQRYDEYMQALEWRRGN